MEKVLESIKNFVMSGNNLYVIIAFGAIILALVIAIIVTSIKKKQVEKQVAEEEAMIEQEDEQKPLAIETIVLSPIVDEEIEPQNDVVVVANETATSLADETVIMTPVREKKRPQKTSKNLPPPPPQEKESSFKEPIVSGEDGKRPGVVQIYIDNGGKYRFRFRSSNNNVVGHSLAYDAKTVCKSKIQSVVDTAHVAMIADSTSKNYVKLLGKAKFEIYKDKENKFRFRLIAQSDETLICSQGYTTKANCLNGIESVRRVAEYHNTVDDAQ